MTVHGAQDEVLFAILQAIAWKGSGVALQKTGLSVQSYTTSQVTGKHQIAATAVVETS